jgi:hypothetical protein
MSVEHVCDMCGNPVEEAAYVCARCTAETARRLTGAELAGEVETTVALLARYGSRSGAKPAELVPADTPELPGASQRVVAFGWQASIERPQRGALRPGRLPVDFHAADRAAAAFGAVTTWARVVEESHDCEPVPVTRRGQHPVAVAAQWLQQHLDWMRHQRYAAEAFADLRDAGAAILQIVDRPPDHDIAGICECGIRLYARAGAVTVTCPGCAQRWDVEASRAGLREALRESLMTAAEAGMFLAFFGLTGDRRRSAKTIVMWAQRGHLLAHGEVGGSPAYLFGDVLDRATRSAYDTTRHGKGDAA